MDHTVDYRLLERFTTSRRLHGRGPDEPHRWLERLRAREVNEARAATAGEPPRRVRTLDLRD